MNLEKLIIHTEKNINVLFYIYCYGLNLCVHRKFMLTILNAQCDSPDAQTQS